MSDGTLLLIIYGIGAFMMAAGGGKDVSPGVDDITMGIWRLLTAALWPLALVMAFSHIAFHRDNGRLPR